MSLPDPGSGRTAALGEVGWGPIELGNQYVAEGWWTDETLGELITGWLRANPGLGVRIHSSDRPWTGTYADVLERSRRAAAGFRELGVQPGEPVAFQLPNWLEAIVTYAALALAGAVPVPIVPFYGPRELEFVCSQLGVRVLLTADRFRHLAYLDNLDQVRARLPDLEHVLVVRGTDAPLPAGCDPFESLLERERILDVPVPVDPNRAALVAYTSGTTSEPKGVVHTHRTVGFEVRQLSSIQRPGIPPALVGAPIGHAIGMLGGILLPLSRQEPIHLIDVWDPETVLRTMREHRLLSGTGATYFLTSLLDHPDFSEDHRALMPFVGLGGAPVPIAVGERAESLGIDTTRVYGCTEQPSLTGSPHDDPRDQRLRTDGRPLVGVELHLLDDTGRQVAPDEPGEIVSRGPDRMAGYTDPALTAATVDTDGWLATGDVGVLDRDGYVTVVDRKKDIIIRGGENVSALEVEELVLRMPGVAEVAVVAAPDARLGEHGCAFVRLLPGADAPRLEQMRAHLADAGLAKPKWPEELRFVRDFPRTPSGKIQKFVLRDDLRSQLESRGDSPDK